MNIEKMTAYHTTNKEAASQIIIDKKFNPSPKEKGHWLGGGVYFYADIYFAMQWGIIGVVKTKKLDDYDIFKEKCDILSADINFKDYEVLDLSVPEGYELFNKILEIVKEKDINEYNRIKKKDDAYKIKTIERLEREYNKKIFSIFDIVYAEYENNIYNKKRKNKSDFLGCTEKQICVKNNDAITNINKIDIKNKNDIFDMIKKNRSVV